MAQNSNQKITKRFVDNVDIPKSGQAFYNDSELRGFKLRVNATGVKAYVVELFAESVANAKVPSKRACRQEIEHWAGKARLDFLYSVLCQEVAGLIRICPYES
jgi:hypothetical protein